MKYLAQNKHWNITEEYNLDKLLYLLIDRPTRIHNQNTYLWENNKNQRHRDYDLPSSANIKCLPIFVAVGYVYWHKNDKLHRENNKPAIIYSDGYKEYWSNGMQLNK